MAEHHGLASHFVRVCCLGWQPNYAMLRQRLTCAASTLSENARHQRIARWGAARAFVDLPDLVGRDLALLAGQVLRLVAVDQLLDARLEGLRVLWLWDALPHQA